MALRDVGSRSSGCGVNGAGPQPRLLRARWRAASIAAGWRFPSDWGLPEVDAVCLALVGMDDMAAPLADLARARARAGAGLDETLADLAALHAVVTAGAIPSAVDLDDTPARLVRLVALAWADVSFGELTGSRCTHGQIGLSTEAYLRTRLAEAYRRATRHGQRVCDGHTLLVVTLDLAQVTGWSRLVVMLVVADVLRDVFDGGESVAVLGPSVAAVLAEREPGFGERARDAGWMLAERLRADRDLCPGQPPDLRVVPLPATEELAVGLLRRLARA